jgi:glycine betaine/proline transport system ATP-binding protein
MTSKVKVQIKNLYKVFGATPTQMIDVIKNGTSKQELLDNHNHVLGLNDVSLEIQQSRIQVIMGLSGSGKSTLIRHFNRLIEPTVGKINVDGQDIIEMDKTELRDFRRFRTSMVFQKFALLPHHTVIDNVAYGLVIQDIDKIEIAERSQRWIDRVGLSGFENYYPAQLSGGMQQRVGLARALATDAEILLMDEAFSALDPLIREEMQDVLIGLQEELKKTIVFITHDLDEALRLGDQIAILRDGAIIQKGEPQDIILNPVDDYVADFTKNINRGRVLRVGSVMIKEKLENGTKIEQDTTLEDALKIFSDTDTTTAIVTYNSKPVGSVRLNSIINVISRPNVKHDGEKTYR